MSQCRVGGSDRHSASYHYAVPSQRRSSIEQASSGRGRQQASIEQVTSMYLNCRDVSACCQFLASVDFALSRCCLVYFRREPASIQLRSSFERVSSILGLCFEVSTQLRASFEPASSQLRASFERAERVSRCLGTSFELVSSRFE